MRRAHSAAAALLSIAFPMSVLLRGRLHEVPLRVADAVHRTDTAAPLLLQRLRREVYRPRTTSSPKPPDERFVGCFSSGSVSSAFVLCLHEDFTFRWRSMIHVGAEMRDARTSAFGEGEDLGRWWAEAIEDEGKRRWNLHLRYEDGRQVTWLVRFYNRNLVKGEDDLWARTGG